MYRNQDVRWFESRSSICAVMFHVVKQSWRDTWAAVKRKQKSNRFLSKRAGFESLVDPQFYLAKSVSIFAEHWAFSIRMNQRTQKMSI